jgi:SAM-dependent methyltransferase
MNNYVKNIFSLFINSQIYLSTLFDKVLPERFRVDGHEDFMASFAPKYLRPHLKVYDVGGGKIPYIDHRRKAELGLAVVGLDIDREELRRAPRGAYDEMICADITRFKGGGDADLIICQAMLEHVKDVEGAFAAMASILKPGGKALLFVPSRNAIYARLNLVIPEGMKRKILFAIFPAFRSCGGFPAYYDRCTPRQFHLLAERHGLEVEEERAYFITCYFSFFFPAYFVWRIWILLFHLIAGDQAAESFSMALRKTAPAGAWFELGDDERGLRPLGVPDSLP